MISDYQEHLEKLGKEIMLSFSISPKILNDNNSNSYYGTSIIYRRFKRSCAAKLGWRRRKFKIALRKLTFGVIR